MVIGIYGRGLANRAGIGRYTRELIRALLASPDGHRFRVYVGPTVAAKQRELLGDSAVVLPGSEGRFFQEQVALASALSRDRVDVFHNPDFTLPLRLPAAMPTVITVHDVAYAKLAGSNSWRSKLLLNTSVPRSLARANRVISVSEFTKREVVDLYKTASDKIDVIPNGVEPRFTPSAPEAVAAVRSRFDLPAENLVLYVGGIEPRKNLVRLAEAVAAIPDAHLAIGGGRNRNAEAILGEATERLGPRLHVLGFVEDEVLPALLGTATVFAYPSLYEGFGIPPVEAMACGDPVACSNAASLPEAVGNAAELFPPTDVPAMTAAIRKLLINPELRRQRIAQGYVQASRFTWRATAEATLRVYESLKS